MTGSGTGLHHLAQVIRDADPRDKAEIYSQLGLRLTYHPGKRAVLAEARPNTALMCISTVSEGGLQPYAHGILWTNWLSLDQPPTSADFTA